MNEINQGSGKGIMLAALIGAAVGAGVALLYAPRSGRETREWLSHKTREIKDRTTSAFEHGKKAVRQVVTEVGRDAEEAGATTRRG